MIHSEIYSTSDDFVYNVLCTVVKVDVTLCVFIVICDRINGQETAKLEFSNNVD